MGGAYPQYAAGEYGPQNVESAAQEIPQRLLPDYLQESAEHERLERITGFEWTITVIPE